MTLPTTHVATRPASRLQRWLAWLFGVWWAVLAVLATLVQAISPDPVVRAILRMVLGVVIFWIVGASVLSLALRRPAQRWFLGHARHWRLLFILSATAMALLEEAVTTSMTNLAPLWGASIAQAHITASGNYLDVVLLHSVIVFVLMFIAWAWLLQRYTFSPPAVFLLFGLTGLLAETGTFGPQNLIQTGFWVYVYGLMVFLPAHAAPPERAARKPGIRAVLLALFLPILAAIPVALLVQFIHAQFFVGLP